MPGLILWKNRELDKMRRDMDRLLSRLWDDFSVPTIPGTFPEEPFFEFKETEDGLIVEAEIPNLNPDAMDVSVADDVLSIRGEIQHETITEQGDYQRVQRRSSTFSRIYQLPCRIVVDETTATYKKGILKIVMPKSTEAKTRGVPIKVSS